jgi:cell wall-associated NlpC family hydrolase
MPEMDVRVLGALALAALTTACASTGAVPHPFPMPNAAAPRTDPGTLPPGPPAPGTVAPGTVAPGTLAPGTLAPGTPAPSFDGYAVTSTALSLRGAPYRNGGTDPKGFDCSGFIQYVFAQHGILLPREVRDQYRVGAPVDPDQLVAGDLLFFATTEPGVSHVAIAIGGDEFVHAPSSTGVVRVEHLGSSYWSPRFLGAKRVN